MRIRPALPNDQQAIVDLIDGVYGEYGDVVCLNGAERDLLDIQTGYRAAGGEFVVLDDGGIIRGSHAVRLLAAQPDTCTFHRLYLDQSLRGGIWGNRLMQWALDWVETHDIRRVEFWSDVRFERAHRFFRRFGFCCDGQIREMDDGAALYSEFFFYLDCERSLRP